MTVSERVALANAIAERLQGRVGRPEKGGNISTISDDTGKTRDIAAAKAGLGSGKTLEAAQRVVEHGAPEFRPNLLTPAITKSLMRKRQPRETGVSA